VAERDICIVARKCTSIAWHPKHMSNPLDTCCSHRSAYFMEENRDCSAAWPHWPTSKPYVIAVNSSVCSHSVDIEELARGSVQTSARHTDSSRESIVLEYTAKWLILMCAGYGRGQATRRTISTNGRHPKHFRQSCVRGGEESICVRAGDQPPQAAQLVSHHGV
jgi:hypothetical protein